jgi:predicted esterase
MPGIMPARTPISSDFPSNLAVHITPAPSSKPPSNVLILLHGLGDTAAPFQKLASQLSLPETACLSIEGPSPLPFDLGGFHWGDDIVFDQSSGTIDPDAEFKKAVAILETVVIEEGLIRKCGFSRRDVFFYGFGQGGMVALALAAATSDTLGGIISIGGPLPESTPSTGGKKKQTPVCILGGSTKTMITSSKLNRIKDRFETVDYTKWSKAGDSMPSSRTEMMPIMRFLGQRLRSTAGVPEGSIAIS